MLSRFYALNSGFALLYKRAVRDKGEALFISFVGQHNFVSVTM